MILIPGGYVAGRTPVDQLIDPEIRSELADPETTDKRRADLEAEVADRRRVRSAGNVNGGDD